jgi:hypothetical protein
MNKNGERGSPCRIPLDGKRGFEGTPFTRMEKKAEDVRFMIQPIQF